MKSQYLAYISIFCSQIILPSYAQDVVTEDSSDIVSTEASDLGIVSLDPSFYGDINQQGGIINNNGSQSVNCGQACFYSYFEINKINTSLGERLETTLGVGINIPLANANSSLTQAQAEKIKNQDVQNYIDVLDAACQAKNFFAVELNARGLARSWDMDYQTLVSSCLEYQSTQ